MRYILPFILLFIACNESKEESFYKEGDILFQDLDCGAACDAIESVTEGVDGWDFSHCGIVAEIDGQLKVVEAYGEVQAVDIDTFLLRNTDSTGKPKVVLGRPKHKELAVKSALLSKRYIGMEYDSEFKLGDDKYYCSELVYECFKKANGGEAYFPLNVMTFKAPGTDSFLNFWVGYYEDLGVPIPEGDSGINPGAISRSEFLEIIALPAN